VRDFDERMEKFNADFDRQFTNAGRAIGLIGIVALVCGLLLTGVIVWGIVQVVQAVAQ
jgi:hypothetical protein